ncbi:FAD-dependent oxidoreductase [Rhodococcus sp. HNM0563]|uniref:FAD-dependent oxidoreductase n=1 Tax=Rhodococcus sp. HNM0563 TaxID=2716339 RepID=UPI00146A4243|nr:FAD-dependent oxidoreductase [Rhodococcus sp. HNM0563]NLU65518.1 FAD-dependent oxidoreductase [Rhodococcus sp. HNM0563]
MSDDTIDVVVIGGGGAGLAAAVSAAEAGASVLLFESETELGGSTQLSAGLFTAAGTSVQAGLGIEDTADKFFQHYMDLNHWILNPGLVRAFCDNAGPTLEWLLELGVEIPARVSSNAHMPGLCQAGVEDVWRGHVPKDQGYGLVQTLDRACRSHGVEAILGTRVQRLLVEGGRVVGVVADDIEVRAHSVVVASGGFAQSTALLEQYYPYPLAAGDSLFVVAAPGSRGDHFGFGEQVDSAVVGENWGLTMPTAYFQRYHHWQAGFPPKSRIYVNKTGRRFMDEDASYAVSGGLMEAQDGPVWAIFDEKARTELPAGYADWDADRIAAEADARRTVRADTLEELAELIDVPVAALVATVDRWNAQLPHGVDDDFLRHRTLANKGSTSDPDPVARGPFYAVRMLPAELVCTHAGLEINQNAEVLDKIGNVVSGLYAAGEAGAGILGLRYVGGGNAVANALTMGRIAGRNAARASSVGSTPSSELGTAGV